MYFLGKEFENSPIKARFIPFVVFLVLTFCQGWIGGGAPYWLYLTKSVAGAWLVWEMRPFVAEMRWAISWEAIVVGVAVCVIWVGLDDFYPKLFTAGPPSNPHLVFGQNSAATWFFVIVHLLGSTIVVPPLE